jgi:hypothetical protein
MMTLKPAIAFAATIAISTVGWSQTTRPATQPSPDQLLDSMLTPDKNVAKPLTEAAGGGIDKSSGTGAVAPHAPDVNVLREGTYIVDRTGRIKHTSDGQTEFIFDADGKAMRDPPVILLPNLMLMSIQTAAANSTRDLHFRITGMVTEYQNRNYVLLDKVVVVPDVVQPLK